MFKKFWNEAVEQLTRAEVLAMEAPLIAEQIKYVYQNSPYYRDRFDQAGINPDQITSHDALSKLPFTEKAELAKYQQHGELFGPHQCSDFESIIRIACTGGSSGEPTRLGWTQNDIGLYNEMGARALWTMGCRPHDMVINCFNYSMYSGGVMDHGAFEYLGAAILAYGIGQSDRLLGLIAQLPPRQQGYSIYMTPSYAVRLADKAQDKGMDLRQLNVKRGYFSGEAGLQIEGYREKIERAWGLTAMDLFGLAELGVQSGECKHRQGLHYSSAGLVAVELIDPHSTQVIAFEDESEGELVFTSLQREACPLIRMRSHDLVRIYTEPCDCGRKSFRFHTLGRSDDMFVVKGVNVFPLGIHQALLKHQPAISAEFFVELEQAPPIDYAPRLVLEVSNSTDKDHYAQLVADIRATIQRDANLTVTIDLVRAGSIASEHKTRRLYRSYLGAVAPQFKVIYREST